MNQKDAAESLKYYLAESNTYQVIALKGQWGGGKTFVFREAESSLPLETYDDEKIPLYASLFGVDSIEELKKRLYSAQLDKIIPKGSAVIDGAKGVASKVPAFLGSVSKLAEGIANIAGAAASSFGEILVDQALKDRLIVLDDLERRGSALSVINVLGFIDFLRARACQVLVIFNEEKIGNAEQQDALQTFREKAFDVEMQLETSPSEAFSIALIRGPVLKHTDLLRTTFERLEVTNIRVAYRILAAAKQVFESASILEEELVAEVLPAVVVVTSIFYGAVPGAPTLDELDQDYQQTRGRPRADHQPKVNELLKTTSPVGAFRNKHMPLVDRRFLRLFIEHIKTGDLLRDEFATFWKTATEELVARRIGLELESWVEDVEWAPTGSAEEFLAIAHSFLPYAAILEPQLKRIVIQEIRGLGDDELATRFAENNVSGAMQQVEHPARSPAEIHAAEPTQTSANEVLKLFKRIADNSINASSGGHHFQKISSYEIERALQTNDTSEFKTIVELLINFKENDVRFEPINLAHAVLKVICCDGGRREAVLRKHLGDLALDSIGMIARGEKVDGWPQIKRIPQ